MRVGNDGFTITWIEATEEIPGCQEAWRVKAEWQGVRQGPPGREGCPAGSGGLADAGLGTLLAGASDAVAPHLATEAPPPDMQEPGSLDHVAGALFQGPLDRGLLQGNQGDSGRREADSQLFQIRLSDIAGLDGRERELRRSDLLRLGE